MDPEKTKPIWPLYIFIGMTLVLAGSIPVMLVAPLFRSTGHPTGSACANNLSTLYKAMHLYAAAFGNDKDFPPHVGKAFWLCLAGQCNDREAHPDSYFVKSPLYGNDELFLCPSCSSGEGDIDYIGPPKLTFAGEPSALKKGYPKDVPIAADARGNHRHGGAVLFYGGRAEYLKGEEYEKALKALE